MQGHHDPDSAVLQIFAPMPCTEAISLFFQVSLNEGLSALPFAKVIPLTVLKDLCLLNPARDSTWRKEA